MKIYIIGPAYPLRGGIADFNLRLAQELTKNGYQVQIISFKLLYPSFLFPGKSQYVEASKGQKPADIPIRPLINTINPINWWRVGHMLRAEKPDLVLLRYWIPFLAPALGTIARIVKKNKKIQLTAFIDNLIPHEKRVGDRILTHYFLRSVQKTICMSETVKNEIKQHSKIPVLVVPHPVYDIYGKLIDKQEAKKKLGLSPSDPTVLFFGFIRSYKGLDILLEAFSIPPLQQSKVKLIIAGEFYVDPEPYQKLIQSKGLSSQIVQITDFIPAHQVHLYFSAADLVALPYKTATQSGISQICIQFSKPMICSNVGGLPEIVKHNKHGFVINPDPVEFSRYINRFFEEKLEEQFTAALSQEKQKYEWRFFAKKMIEFHS